MYYFQTSQFWDNEIMRLCQNSSMQNIPMEKIRKFRIPLPSLDKQQMIVDALDKFEALSCDISQGLPLEIAYRKKQYEYYRDKLLMFKEFKA